MPDSSGEANSSDPSTAPPNPVLVSVNEAQTAQTAQPVNKVQPVDRNQLLQENQRLRDEIHRLRLMQENHFLGSGIDTLLAIIASSEQGALTAGNGQQLNPQPDVNARQPHSDNNGFSVATLNGQAHPQPKDLPRPRESKVQMTPAIPPKKATLPDRTAVPLKSGTAKNVQVKQAEFKFVPIFDETSHPSPSSGESIGGRIRPKTAGLHLRIPSLSLPGPLSPIEGHENRVQSRRVSAVKKIGKGLQKMEAKMGKLVNFITRKTGTSATATQQPGLRPAMNMYNSQHKVSQSSKEHLSATSEAQCLANADRARQADWFCEEHRHSPNSFHPWDIRYCRKCMKVRDRSLDEGDKVREATLHPRASSSGDRAQAPTIVDRPQHSHEDTGSGYEAGSEDNSSDSDFDSDSDDTDTDAPVRGALHGGHVGVGTASAQFNSYAANGTASSHPSPHLANPILRASSVHEAIEADIASIFSTSVDSVITAVYSPPAANHPPVLDNNYVVLTASNEQELEAFRRIWRADIAVRFPDSAEPENSTVEGNTAGATENVTEPEQLETDEANRQAVRNSVVTFIRRRTASRSVDGAESAAGPSSSTPDWVNDPLAAHAAQVANAMAEFSEWRTVEARGIFTFGRLERTMMVRIRVFVGPFAFSHSRSQDPVPEATFSWIPRVDDQTPGRWQRTGFFPLGRHFDGDDDESDGDSSGDEMSSAPSWNSSEAAVVWKNQKLYQTSCPKERAALAERLDKKRARERKRNMEQEDRLDRCERWVRSPAPSPCPEQPESSADAAARAASKARQDKILDKISSPPPQNQSPYSSPWRRAREIEELEKSKRKSLRRRCRRPDLEERPVRVFDSDRFNVREVIAQAVEEMGEPDEYEELFRRARAERRRLDLRGGAAVVAPSAPASGPSASTSTSTPNTQMQPQAPPQAFPPAPPPVPPAPTQLPSSTPTQHQNPLIYGPALEDGSQLLVPNPVYQAPHPPQIPHPHPLIAPSQNLAPNTQFITQAYQNATEEELQQRDEWLMHLTALFEQQQIAQQMQALSGGMASMQSVLASLGVSGGPSGDGLASTAGQLPGLNLSAAFASPAAPAQQESEADVDDGEALSASQEQPSEEDVINGEMMEEEDEFGAYFVQNYGVEWSPPQPDPEDDEDDGDDSTSLAAPQQQSGGYDDDDDEEGPAPPIAEQPRSSLLSDGVAVAFFRQGGQGQGQGQGGNGNGNGNASGGGGAGAGLGA